MQKCKCGGKQYFGTKGSGSTMIISIECLTCGKCEEIGTFEEVLDGFLVYRDEITPIIDEMYKRISF